MDITKDSKRAITIQRVDDTLSYICMYDLDTYEEVFKEKLGGDPEQYIKVKEI
jgi:hypothetical protein